MTHTVTLPAHVVRDLIDAARAMRDATNQLWLAHHPWDRDGAMSIEEAQDLHSEAWAHLRRAEYYAQKALDASEVK